MKQSHQKTGLINWLLLLGAAALSVFVTRLVGSTAGWMVTATLGVGALVALASYFQGRLEAREALEKLEFDELNKAKSSAALFSGDADTFSARRSREQFERFFVPVLTVLFFLLEAAAVFWFWKYLDLGKDTKPLVADKAMLAAGLYGGLFLILFLFGKVAANLARLEKDRLLRAGAGFMLLGAYFSLILAVAVTVTVQGHFPTADLWTARVLSIVLGVIGLETLAGLVLELYRPRTKAGAERVLYESRLAGLFGQPEGIFKTAAHALDYQFGFKVSETGFYRFLEKYAGILLLTQLVVLLASTCLVFVETGEEALWERFGQAKDVLKPGLHFKLPYPIDRAIVFRTEKIQGFVVGAEQDDEHDAMKTVVWTLAHEKEENFLVANHENPAVKTEDAKKAPPVNLLSVSIPVQYQITNLSAWAYNHENGAELLTNLAVREVVRYLANADLNELMSKGRSQAAQVLQERLQTAVNERELGVNIVFVGLQDIHPPVMVAADYETVASAWQTRAAALYSAQAYAVETNALSRATAIGAVNRAEASRVMMEVSAGARAASFTNQIPAYRASPTVYAQRKFLEAFAAGSRKARKYVIASTNTTDVFQLNLEDKLRTDLQDVSIPDAKK